jgi:hypothetical protein
MRTSARSHQAPPYQQALIVPDGLQLGAHTRNQVCHRLKLVSFCQACRSRVRNEVTADAEPEQHGTRSKSPNWGPSGRSILALVHA